VCDVYLLIGQERGKERRLSLGVPSPVSVEGFESGGLSGGLADSDEDDVGESGSVSVAGPEKAELTVERAGDWDDWDDWDEEADDIDDLVRHPSQSSTPPVMNSVSCRLIPWAVAAGIDTGAAQVLEFGRCITSIRAEFGQSAAVVAGTDTEASRRQFLGIRRVEDALLDSTPLAPDDDIIINW
jgi:hypothetical protein